MSKTNKIILFNIFIWVITTVVGVFVCKLTRNISDLYAKPESVKNEIHRIWTEPYEDLNFVIDSIIIKDHGMREYETRFIDHPIDKVNGLPFILTISEYNDEVKDCHIGDTLCLKGRRSFNDLYKNYGCSTNYKTLEVIGEPFYYSDFLLFLIWFFTIVIFIIMVFCLMAALDEKEFYDVSYILYVLIYCVLVFSNLFKLI